jgi:hypothetical protein
MRRIGIALTVIVAMSVLVGTSVGPVHAAAPANPGDSKNCSDFMTWAAANTFFWTYHGLYGDVAQLDVDGDRIACETLTGAPATAQLPAPVANAGYWMLEGATSQVYGFGDAYVSPRTVAPSVAIAAAPNGGYLVLAASGKVSTHFATWFGDVNTAGFAAGEVLTTIAGKPDGTGYWAFTNRGRAIPFGSAEFYGDMNGVTLNGPVVASAVTPTGRGYWMVASDGGIFNFGDATFSGSTGNLVLNQPVVGIAPDLDGRGYWLVAADGGIFAFDAPFRGSLPGTLPAGSRLNKPVIGALAYGNGYLMVAADGGIFSFSDKPFLGSLGDAPPANPIVGVAVWRS